ncbi:hypothetical protein EST38_g7742 [Candolleomyces aberdarensis]|uniref:Nephrocystin 3-like N-terminal domain-containing protein n=1 Tax=Candolleomyces aberdarensis TaxID=2316362 RepID=A0A4Q2DEX2_9AGAR|nr:hypothetical protein EST38_g7742 [Candolleomyces aberdarensis]
MITPRYTLFTKSLEESFVTYFNDALSGVAGRQTYCCQTRASEEEAAEKASWSTEREIKMPLLLRFMKRVFDELQTFIELVSTRLQRNCFLIRYVRGTIWAKELQDMDLNPVAIAKEKEMMSLSLLIGPPGHNNFDPYEERLFGSACLLMLCGRVSHNYHLDFQRPFYNAATSSTMATISHFSNAGNFSITNSSLTFISNSNVDVIQEDLRMFLLDQLGPSHIADHKFCLVGEKREVLRRATCTPGTRIAILASIIKWANDTSAESQDIYWLFGPAGSGKSTIAYTIARRFELAIEVEDTIFLGGNFFCSRQFEDTKYETYIVRTIVYHLALRCKAFADALRCSGKFDTVHRSVRAQLQDLLVGPWLESESTCEDPPSRRYLIVIDALDEIDQQGGSAFLRDLLDVIKDNHLLGLKFFFTSRQDPGLVDQVESFTRKRLYRLQDVEKEEVEADITTYLAVRLPHFKDRDEMKKLVTFTSGLFICAATLIKYLSPHKLTPREQSTLLRRLLPDSVIPQPPSKATDLLDALYHQILSDAFSHLDGDILQERLQILHTFLCTPERTSTSIIANLLSSGSDETDSVWSFTEVADAVLSSLHAVLYTDTDNHVLSYHKSFSDFMFDCRRSKEYWCDQTPLHHHLTESCFRVMNAGLKFNIANIPSSFIFDSENHALRNEAERNIPPTLSYACRNWSHHLSATVPTAVDPLLVTLSTFLELRVLFWIEAMNLLGFRGLCDPILQTAREWIANVGVMLTE